MNRKSPINLGIICLIILFACSPKNPEIPGIPHTYSGSAAYKNPVIKGFNPDPSICRVGDDYYLVCSSFEYFPGVPIYHSGDLVNWRQIGNVLNRKSQLNLDNASASGGIFAPTIRYHDSIFYMITTNVSTGQNIIVTTSDLSGEWSDPVLVQQKNIDPSLLFDDDGKIYYTGTTPWDGKSPQGIYQAELNIKTGQLLSPYRLIWTGTGGRYPEGPHLYKINKWYYLMISEGGTENGHFVTMARSKSPWGPFEECPHNPILTNRNEPYSNPVQNSGHADIIQAADGKWWMVHLAVRNVNMHHHLGRETFLLPLEWDAQGWPLINQNGVSQIEIFAEAPGIQKSSSAKNYDFKSAPGPEWIHLRNPVKTNYLTDTIRGNLVLKGTGISLNDLASPTFIGIRQEDMNMQATLRLQCTLTENSQEAGLTAYMNNEHYYSVNLFRKAGKNFVRVLMKLGTAEHIASTIPYNGKEVYLRISSNPGEYTFSWSKDGISFEELARNYTHLLSTETAGGFTGIILGIYASSNGGEDGPVAYIDEFSYVPATE